MSSMEKTENVKVGAEYDFVEEPPQEYFCPVTFSLLLDPYQTRCCGNLLSRKAIQELEGKPCPVCREGSNRRQVSQKKSQDTESEVSTQVKGLRMGGRTGRLRVETLQHQLLQLCTDGELLSILGRRLSVFLWGDSPETCAGGTQVPVLPSASLHLPILQPQRHLPDCDRETLASL